MSYMDDVIPVRVNLTSGLSPRWDPRPRALVAITEEEISSTHPVPPTEELPTYDEVMQNEMSYHSAHCGAYTKECTNYKINQETEIMDTINPGTIGKIIYDWP